MRYFVKITNLYSHKVETEDELVISQLLSSGWREVNESLYDSTEAYTADTINFKELQQENKLLKAQLKAQTERSDFIEDCIAEMATQVYGGV